MSVPLSPAGSSPAVVLVDEESEERHSARTSQSDNHNAYFVALDSIARVTIAGFGGFLAGLSLARRRGGVVGGVVARQAAASMPKSSRLTAKGGLNNEANATVRGELPRNTGSGASRLQPQRIIRSTPPLARPYVDQELPYMWAIAVSSFAGVVEFCRVMSPSSIIWDLMKGESKPNGASEDDKGPCLQPEETGGNILLPANGPLDHSTKTITDFIIGGSIAGAIFKGASIRTRFGARFDASIMGTPKPSMGRPLSGLCPGAALGALAGIVTVAVELAQVAVEEKFGPALEGDVGKVDVQNESRNVIPADIHAMSTEELVKSIEKLKRGKSEACEEHHTNTELECSADDLLETSQQSHGGRGKTETKSILSALGFRPHPSQ